MDRQTIVRLQLAALAVLALLVLVRAFGPNSRPSALVQLEGNLRPGELHTESFTVSKPVRVRIDATGSLQDSDELAAYGWLVRREDRATPWAMDPAKVRRGRTTLAHAEAVIELEPGTYDAFFTTFGNHAAQSPPSGFWRRFIGRSSPQWHADSRRWQFIVQLPSGQPQDAVSHGAESTGRSTEALWSTGPVGNNRHLEVILELPQGGPLGIYALGEIGDDALDYGWIEELYTGKRAWTFMMQNTFPAGGASRNRVFDGTIELPPGVYRAVYRSNRTHAYGGWAENPPLDPSGWGMHVTGDPSLNARVMDPWMVGEPAVRLHPESDSEDLQAVFETESPARILVYALGEGTGSRVIDYGWIERLPSGETVWEMNARHSNPAGGSAKNRLTQTAVDLEAGRYAVRFRTDGSHSPAGWTGDPPDHPERWGIALFPLDGAVRQIDSDLEPVAPEPHRDHPREPVQAAETLDADEVTLPEIPAPVAIAALSAHPPVPGAVLVNLAGLPDNSRKSAPLILTERTSLHIHAVGEIMLSGRFDYGWIEEEGSGRVVWEMTRQNTEHAGGALKNRRFDGVIVLPAGRYQVHFLTDGSHAHGSFNQDPPDDPSSWGIRVSRLR